MGAKEFVGNPTPDSVLLTRCAEGDRDSWEKIVHRYERLVFAVARREGLSEEAAADVTQHAFGELVRRFDSIDQPDRLKSWLLTVVRREIWRLRAQPDTREIDDQGFVDDAAAFEERLARSAEVHEAVDGLGEPCRTLILSLFFDPAEPDYATIAAKIGRPVGSVGPTRIRCLARLRENLEWLHPDE